MSSSDGVNILDLPIEVTIQILRRLSAKDLAFSAQDVCPEWKSIISNWDEIWSGDFRAKSNFEEVGKALEYLRRAPLIQNLYLGKCDCTNGVDVARDREVVDEICKSGKKIRVLRIYNPHPDEVEIFVRNLPKLEKIQLEVGLYQINSGRVTELRSVMSKLGSRVEVEWVSIEK